MRLRANRAITIMTVAGIGVTIVKRLLLPLAKIIITRRRIIAGDSIFCTGRY